MADYSGFFLKGLAGGLQSGLNMGQQLQEMKWQKTQRKRLKEKQDKIQEQTAYLGNLFNQYGADKVYSEDEVMQLSTAIWASAPEIQAVFKDSINAIQTMNKSKFEEDLRWLDYFIDWTENIDPSDIQGIFDTVKGRVKTEKGRNYFTAYEGLQKKKYEAGQKARDIEIGKMLPSDYRYPYFKEKGMVGEITPTETPETASMADEKSAVNILKMFVNASPSTFEAKKASLEQSKDLDLSAYTQDILKETGNEIFNLYDTPSEVIANVKAPAGLTIIPKRDKTGKYYASFSKKTTTPTPGGRVTSLPLQEEYKQKTLDANTWEDAQSVTNTYIDAGYDPSEMPTKQEWINGKLEELDSHIAMLKEITDEEGKLMGSKKFKFLSGGDEESKTGESWYKDIYEAYNFYLEELKKMGIDTSKYTKIKSPGEIQKSFWGKYPSIYY